MTIAAVTDNTTLRVLKWGQDAAGVPSAEDGQTRHTDIDDGGIAVIDAAGPEHTKVVDSEFVEMTTQEKTTVDAATAVVVNASVTDEFLAILDAGVVHDYGNVSGPITLDFGNGNGLAQKMTLTGDLTLNDITVILPPKGLRQITLEVAQDATGGWDIPANAWDSKVNWGTKAAPDFSLDAALGRRFLVFDFRGDDTEVCVSFTTNVF